MTYNECIKIYLLFYLYELITFIFKRMELKMGWIKEGIKILNHHRLRLRLLVHSKMHQIHPRT